MILILIIAFAGAFSALIALMVIAMDDLPEELERLLERYTLSEIISALTRIVENQSSSFKVSNEEGEIIKHERIAKATWHNTKMDS